LWESVLWLVTSGPSYVTSSQPDCQNCVSHLSVVWSERACGNENLTSMVVNGAITRWCDIAGHDG